MSETRGGGDAGGAKARRSPRRIVLLRHGQTTHNAAGIWQGQLDAPLSQVGHEQAAAAAVALASLAPVEVVASDLARAADTGAEVARVCGVTVRPDPRWREIHAGQWQGLTNTEVRQRFPLDQERLASGEDFKRGVDGESLADVRDRVEAALADLVADLPAGATVVVASHGVAARAGAAVLLGLSPQDAWLKLAVLGNCHWAELIEGDRGWRLAGWNLHA